MKRKTRSGLMGASSSRPEEDKALQLCRERKKFVRQALDGRCSLAATHVTYIASLKIIGNALRRFVETEVPIESSLQTSTTATPELFALTEKSLSQFSFSSPSQSQRVGAAVKFSPSHSPPTSGQYKTNHMKIKGTFSRKVEEKPSVPVTGSVTSSNTPKNTIPPFVNRTETSPFDTSTLPPETPPWDYFGLFHPIDNDFSSQEGRRSNQGLEEADDIWKRREEENIPELEDEEEKASPLERQDFQESEDEFDEPSTEMLVRRFENVNRTADHVAVSASSAMPSAKSVASETEVLNGVKHNSPELSPIRATNSGVGSSAIPSDKKTEFVKEDGTENKALPKDLISCMKDIESLFVKASESGEEVPRMLEANKFHFRPIFPGKERESMTSVLLKTCFSCGDDPSQVQEEPAQTTTKYLTWHRTTSSRSSSSRNPLGANTREDMEDLTNNLFDNFCMNAGSHASTLDRLYAWERKLYDEVKASEIVRRAYDQKRKLLRGLESNGESSHKIDKTRAIVKDLHSRIGVAIHRIDSISRKIEDLRDKELQPQLEELIEGLRRMWEVMYECHKNQLQIISVAFSNSAHPKVSSQSESDSHRQSTVHLEYELNALSSSFTKWIGSQETYVQALNGWLFKCVLLQQKSTSKRKRRMQPPPLRNYGPPIYVTCGVWLDLLHNLPTKEVADSINGLAAEIAHFLPRQEKNQGRPRQAAGNSDSGDNLLRVEVSEDLITGFDRLRSSLVGFLGQLNNFAGCSVKMFTDLQTSIQEAKSSYVQPRSQT